MPLFAQDVIIGGDVNMSSLQIAIDSTMNVTDNILFITKFKGTTVTYYNLQSAKCTLSMGGWTRKIWKIHKFKYSLSELSEGVKSQKWTEI